MSIDRAAQAAQLARLYAHAGEPLMFGALEIPGAVVEAWQPAVTDTDRNVGDDTCVLVKIPRALFGGTLPRQGQHFTGPAGALYRVQSLPSLSLSAPLVHFVCAVTALPT